MLGGKKTTRNQKSPLFPLFTSSIKLVTSTLMTQLGLKFATAVYTGITGFFLLGTRLVAEVAPT